MKSFVIAFVLTMACMSVDSADARCRHPLRTAARVTARVASAPARFVVNRKPLRKVFRFVVHR